MTPSPQHGLCLGQGQQHPQGLQVSQSSLGRLLTMAIKTIAKSGKRQISSCPKDDLLNRPYLRTDEKGGKGQKFPILRRHSLCNFYDQNFADDNGLISSKCKFIRVETDFMNSFKLCIITAFNIASLNSNLTT